MLNQEKLQKLFVLATGKQPAAQVQKEESRENKSNRMKKSRYNLAKRKGLNSDPLTAWESWYRDEIKTIKPDEADDFWSEAEKEFPGSPDQAKDWMRREAKSLVNKNDPAIKDIAMRNNISKAPTWLSREMLPELAQTSAVVSSQNLNKMKTVYKKAIEQKIGKVDLTQLDPEVPVDVHVEDAVKLEAMGLFDGAQIFNGRFAVNNGGQPQMAFSLQLDQSMIEDGPENQVIQEVATPIFMNAIGSAMSEATGMLELNNKTSRSAMRQMLQKGELDISSWKDALQMIGNEDDVISAGMEGLVNRNPYMDQEELLSSTMDISNIKEGFV